MKNPCNYQRYENNLYQFVITVGHNARVPVVRTYFTRGQRRRWYGVASGVTPRSITLRNLYKTELITTTVLNTNCLSHFLLKLKTFQT